MRKALWENTKEEQIATAMKEFIIKVKRHAYKKLLER